MDGEKSVKRKQSTLSCYFPTTSNKSKVKKQEHVDSMAQALSQRLNSEAHNLSGNSESWYVLQKSWLPPASEEEFKKEWDLHPDTRHSLKVYGRVCQEKRWSRAWGVHYPYSGSVALARPIDESHILSVLLQKISKLTNEFEFKGKEYSASIYNGCLQNWYEPFDAIGLHADDERAMKREYPIFSLSWGGLAGTEYFNLACLH